MWRRLLIRIMYEMKMTPEQQNLYAQICQFKLEQPSASLPFSVK